MLGANAGGGVPMYEVKIRKYRCGGQGGGWVVECSDFHAEDQSLRPGIDLQSGAEVTNDIYSSYCNKVFFVYLYFFEYFQKAVILLVQYFLFQVLHFIIFHVSSVTE